MPRPTKVANYIGAKVQGILREMMGFGGRDNLSPRPGTGLCDSRARSGGSHARSGARCGAWFAICKSELSK